MLERACAFVRVTSVRVCVNEKVSVREPDRQKKEGKETETGKMK